MKVDLKYVTLRRNADGSSRYYWQRPGHPLVRLPIDPVERFMHAARLNAEAENRRVRIVGPVTGTMRAVIEAYRSSEAWLSKARQTQISYGVWLRRIETTMGDAPVAAIDRATVVDFIEAVETAGNRKVAAAVLRVLLGQAYYRGLVQVNHADKLGLKAPPPRAEFFTADDCAAWRVAAARHPDADRMLTAFALLLHTAQRPRDCLAMPWGRYNGDVIELRQQKTKRLLAVPCHIELRGLLDARRRLERTSVLICGALTYRRFNAAWNDICAATGLIDKQARDMRRTAVIRLAEAGCDDIEISSISGHSIKDVRSILDSVYLVRTDPVARRAIEKLENADRTNANVNVRKRRARPQKP